MNNQLGSNPDRSQIPQEVLGAPSALFDRFLPVSQRNQLLRESVF